MIFNLFKTKKNGELVTDIEGTPQPLAKYVFDEKATVKTYAARIAEGLVLDAVRKKYFTANEAETPTQPKPKTAFEIELAIYEARHKQSNLKITLNADPTEENGGFHIVVHGEDFGVRSFENDDILSVCFAKLATENADYVKLIQLFHECDLSYKEIAESKLTRYTSEESCKSHTSRAIKRFRDIAQAEGLFNQLTKKRKA